MAASPPPTPQREPSAARELVGELGSAAKFVADPIVADIVSTISMLVLIVIMVPVGIVIVAVGFIAMAAAFAAVGSPTGTLATVITLAGLLGILAALFFSFRALYRRMPRRLRASYAAPMETNTELSQAFAHEPAGAAPSVQSAPAPTLAELDARLAPPPLPAKDAP
jgi:hypothetical protein